MKYIVIEIQTNTDGTIGVPPVSSFDDRNAAEARYHSILSIAAESLLPEHTAILIDSTGRLLSRQCYTHRIEPTEE